MARRLKQKVSRKAARRLSRTRAAAASRKPAVRKASARQQRDAIALLKDDHRAVKSLFETLKTARGERRAASFERLKEALTVHTKLEESIFYPAFRAAAKIKKDREMFHEAMEEHHTVDVVLPEVRKALADEDVFAARLKVLCELVHHHIEEEETELFPRTRALLSAAALRNLGEQIVVARRTAPALANPLRVVASLVGFGR